MKLENFRRRRNKIRAYIYGWGYCSNWKQTRRWIVENGIEDPRYQNEGSRHFAVIEGADLSVVTSGDYQRYIEIDGKRYHHIFNPYTGYPAEANVMSTTVVGKSSIDADALATAIFVLGVDEGLKIMEKTNEFDGIIVTKDKYVYITKGLKDKVDIIKKEYNQGNI